MAETAVLAGSDPPWLERLFDAIPWPAFRLGGAAAIVAVVVFLSLEQAAGRLVRAAPSSTDTLGEDIRIAVVLILAATYTATAFVFAARRARETWRELAPRLRGSPAERQALVAAAGRYDRGALRIAGLVGIALGIAVQLFIDQETASLRLLSLPTEAMLHRVLLATLAWWIGRLVYAQRVEGRRLSLAARERLEVDLLDARAAAPLVRHGLRSALLAVGLLCLVALLFYDVEAAPGLASALALLLPLTALLAGSLLLLPLRGVRDAVLAAKCAELAWCNDEIRRRRAALERSGESPVGLADLVAWKQHVGDVREWPIDAPTARRFALYLALPLGSWLGGALVERLVDRLLQ